MGERTFDEATGKGKTRLHFEEREKPIGKNKPHSNPLSRPAQEAGICVHNKIHSVEKDNSGVEGAHKSEELAAVSYTHLNEISLFAGLIKCGECGKSLTIRYTNAKHPQQIYSCKTYNAFGKNHCTQHRIDYDTLYSHVLRKIRECARAALMDGEAVADRLTNTCAVSYTHLFCVLAIWGHLALQAVPSRQVS